MITLRRANERHHERRRKQDVWLTFHAQAQTDLARGFGALERLNEDRIPPGGSVASHPPRDAEVVTYVREGVLAYEDTAGRSGVIYAGEFQRTTAGRGNRPSETNASRTDWAHVFQIWLRPVEAAAGAGLEHKRFGVADRRGCLCTVASPDGRDGSLRLRQQVLIYSALLDRGQHLVHELAPERSAWLHVVQGDVTLGNVILTTGDGAGITAERAVSLTAREDAEILLIDLGDLVGLAEQGGVS